MVLKNQVFFKFNKDQYSIEGVINNIISSYDPESPLCCFNYFFYNVVDPKNLFLMLQKLMQETSKKIDPKLWEEANRLNPNPNKLLPVPARSFDDIKLRTDEQSKQIKNHLNILKISEQKVHKIQTKHNTKILSNIEKIKTKNMELSAKLLKIQKKIEVLMQKGVGIGTLDMKAKSRLENIQEQLHKPNQFQGRLNEILPSLNQQPQNFLNNNYDIKDEDLLPIIDLLSLQNDGLKQLVNILQKDFKDMNLISQWTRDRKN